MEEFFKSLPPVGQVVVLLGLLLGGIGAGIWAGVKSKVGGKDKSLHGKVEGIALNILTLTNGVKNVQDDIHDIRVDQAEMKSDIRKAVNDRAVIIDRLSHLEGRAGAPRGRR